MTNNSIFYKCISLETEVRAVQCSVKAVNGAVFIYFDVKAATVAASAIEPARFHRSPCQCAWETPQKAKAEDVMTEKGVIRSSGRGFRKRGGVTAVLARPPFFAQD